MEKWGVKLRDSNNKTICRGSPLEVYTFMARAEPSVPFAIIERALKLKDARFMNLSEFIHWTDEEPPRIMYCGPKVLDTLKMVVSDDVRVFVYASRDLGYNIHYYPLTGVGGVVDSGDYISLGESESSWKNTSLSRKSC